MPDVPNRGQVVLVLMAVGVWIVGGMLFAGTLEE